MGSRYLTDLANVCRNAGLQVQEEPGWQSRARSSGGYESGRPTTVMCHHTASNPSSDGQNDVNYICYGSADRPLSNLYINRAGKVWVMAAGATNTNGKGHDSWGGGVPDDSMNTYAIGIEVANNGTGETYPTAQQEAYVRLVNALRDAYGIPSAKCRAHFEWAPDRKVDNAGSSRWASGSNKWNMNAFRADVEARWPGGGPSKGNVALLEEKVHYYLKPQNEASSSTTWISDGTYKWAAHSGSQLDQDRFFQEVRLQQLGAAQAVAKGFSETLVLDENGFRAFGYNIDPLMTGRDAWGWRD